LKKVIAALTIQGSTALGPGLLSAVELASRGAVGSKVILCTDGEANVGIGGNNSMDSHGFYERMAAHAKTKRVMISILSLKGDKCNVK
jgi:Mg-chelatase subunit ChlD